MAVRAIFLVAGLFASCCLAAISVTIEQGAIHGVATNVVGASGSAVLFKGIPYTEPPQRWRVSELASTPFANGVFNASHYGSACPQNVESKFNPAGDLTNVTMSENCLHLNVFAAQHVIDAVASGSSKKVPVALYIHGGSFIHGAGSFLMFDAKRVVAKQTSMNASSIVVTINYRMGVFGFGASSDLASLNPNGETGTLGLLDQRTAMAWVQKNIGAFGGDPSKVTIWGESAGAASISNHLAMPESWPYFSQAIIESGSPALWNAKSLGAAQCAMDRVQTHAQCSSLACLQGLSMAELLAAQAAVGESIVTSRGQVCGRPGAPPVFQPPAWAPVVDGVALKSLPVDAGRRGLLASGKSVLVGANQNEGFVFLPATFRGLNQAQFEGTVAALFGLDGVFVAQVLALYPYADYVATGDPSFWALQDIQGDHSMICPSRRLAKTLSTMPNSKVHTYFWDFDSVLWRHFDGGGLPGSFHAAELPFVFDSAPEVFFETAQHVSPGDFAQEILFANAISQSWQQFVIDGVPGVDANNLNFSYWPEFGTSYNYQNITGSGGSLQTHLKTAKCDMLDRITASVAQDVAKATVSSQLQSVEVQLNAKTAQVENLVEQNVEIFAYFSSEA